MPVTFDYILGEPLLHDHRVPIYSANPPVGLDGELIINSTTNQLLIWYANQWQLVAQLAAPTINIKRGQPRGLAGVTYDKDIT